MTVANEVTIEKGTLARMKMTLPGVANDAAILVALADCDRISDGNRRKVFSQKQVASIGAPGLCNEFPVALRAGDIVGIDRQARV